MPLKDMHTKVCEIVKEHGLGDMPYEFYENIMLTIAGYHTPSKDLKKGSGLLSDEMHRKFAPFCSIIISNDENFRKKLRSSYSVSEKAVVDLSAGLRLFEAMLKTMQLNEKNRS